jgi:prenyltransferase beta subunit
LEFQIFNFSTHFQNKESFEYWATEHLRVSGMYWGLTALDVMNAFNVENEVEREKTIQHILSCQHPNGTNYQRDSKTIFQLFCFS